MKEGEDEAAASSSSNSSEEDEDQEPEHNDGVVSEYEQQRLVRIRENRARLQALGLPDLASSLVAPLSKRQKELGQAKSKGKSKKKKDVVVDDDDDEYRPSDDDRREAGYGESSSDSEEQEEEGAGPSSGPRRKGKKKSPLNTAKVRRSSFMKRNGEDLDQIDDDAALQHAIALSLGGIAENLAAASDVIPPTSNRMEAGASVHAKRNKVTRPETAGRGKSRKMSRSRFQLTEDEVVAYFFCFDESGKGYISPRDLQKMVAAHNFNWTESEIAGMIHFFDGDQDGKLSLEDFQTIVSRCNMMQEKGDG